MIPPDFALRHRMGSYGLVGFAGALVSSWVVMRILLVHDWRLLGSLEIGWIMFAVWVYLGLTYQVIWRDGKLVMKTLGKPEVILAPADIQSAAMDTEARAKLMGITRSSARIKITASSPWDAPAAIYISLGHFTAQDITRLMQAITAERPDLDFPKNWIATHQSPRR